MRLVSSPAALLATLISWELRPVAAFSYDPISAPLAVNSPFLANYGPSGPNTSPVSANWPTNAYDHKYIGWEAMARVDNASCNVLGAAAVNGSWVANPVRPSSTTITATQSIYTFPCGGVDITLTFLDPIEPTDFTRMSLPFSYMSVVASPNDGKSHAVQFYTDTSGEILSGNTADNMTWSTEKTTSIVYHKLSLSSPVQFSALNSRVAYGTGYFGMLLGDGVTYQTADDVSMRSAFNQTGKLNNTADTNPRAIGDHWPCMGLSKNFGTINAPTSPTVFVMGLTRDPAISYIVNSGPQTRSLYYKTQFSSDQDALSFFLTDYDKAVTAANAFDARLSQQAAQISPEYADVVALATRQVFSSVEVTVPTGSDGKLNSSDVLLFMGAKGVNRMESIYASSPFWLWANPNLLNLLLQPILQWHRRTSGTSAAVSYVIDDLGDTYPQATGPSTLAINAPKSLESTGNLMIVTAALIRATGDYSIVSNNADLYKAWGQYLRNNALNPGNQKTSDGSFTGANPVNDTNLAVKGIVALKAYGNILTGLGQDGSSYSNAAASYASQWQSLAATPSGYTNSFGDSNSWGMTYNLFADKWLRTGLFPDPVFQKLSSIYGDHLNKFGVPLSSASPTTTGQWMAFAAGLVPDTQTRNDLVSKIQSWIANGPDRVPWTVSFDSVNGTAPGDSSGRPDIGGVFALLVRDLNATNGPATGGGAPSGATLSVTSPALPMISTLILALSILFVLH